MSRLLERFRKPKTHAPNWEAMIGEHVIDLKHSAQLKLVIAAAVGGPIHVLDSTTGTLRFRLIGHESGTLSLALHPNGRRLASSGQDGKVRRWDLIDGSELPTLDAGSLWVSRVLWSLDGALLASAAGKKLKLWTENGRLIREYPDHGSTISDLAWMPKSDLFVSSEYGSVNFWSTEKTEIQRVLKWKGSILAVAVSPDEKYIAAGAQDSSVHIWRLKDGTDMEMTGYPCKVRELSWESTGRWLATGGGPSPCIWDCSGKGPADTMPLQFNAHKKQVSCLAFSPKSALLACAGLDGCLGFWHMKQGSKPAAVAAIEEAYSVLTWNSTGTSLIAGSDTGRVVAYPSPE